MIPLIDCHMHLQEPVLMRDLARVLERALGVGVRWLVVNGSSEEDWERVAGLAGEDKGTRGQGDKGREEKDEGGRMKDEGEERSEKREAGSGKEGIAGSFSRDPKGSASSAADSPLPPTGNWQLTTGNSVSILPCFGLHPWYIADRSDHWLQSLESYLLRFPRAPIGEIGLDRWREPRDEADQQRVFLAQMDLAQRLGRPVMIHCLRAWGWLMGILRSRGPVPAGMLIHAYGGPADLVEELTGLGAYFSFSATIMEEKRSKAREALAAVPMDRLLIETDAPDMLPPVEYRIHAITDGAGKLANEPANLAGALRAVAQVRRLSEQSVAAAVWANARRLFAL